MTTFNGEKFLHKQLSSIANQFGVSVRVRVNDDGSSDRTMEILKYWQAKGLIESISLSKNLGSAQGFFHLLNQYELEFPVALSDQDDVWEKDKLLKQLTVIKSEGPMVVAANRRIIDLKGANIKSEMFSAPNSLHWKNAVFENILFGNTILMNRKAIDLVRSLSGKGLRQHDSAIYLLFSVVGQIAYIEEELVNYRIHSGNAIGLRRQKVIWEVFVNFKNYYRQMIVVLELVLRELQPNIEFIEFGNEVASRNFLSRSFYILRSDIYRQRSKETFLAKTLFCIATFRLR